MKTPFIILIARGSSLVAVFSVVVVLLPPIVPGIDPRERELKSLALSIAC